MYTVTKTYGHELGLSACFRQWRTDTHCKFLHGYAVGFSFTFACSALDKNGWVINFGELKPLKAYLSDKFDHETLVADDDPFRPEFVRMAESGLIQMQAVPHTGCEAFAKQAADWVIDKLLATNPDLVTRGVRLLQVECREHAGNAATYYPIWTGAEQ